jgi:hypothetical protein
VRVPPAAAGVIQGALGVAAGAVATASELVDGRFQKDPTGDIPGPSFLHQIIPRTSKTGCNPLCRGDQDIDFPGLDSLLIADRARLWGPTDGPGDAPLIGWSLRRCLGMVTRLMTTAGLLTLAWLPPSG